MSHVNAALPPLKPPARAAATLIAAVCAAGVNMGLLELFDHASSERWLVATPQVLEAKAQCDAKPAREARTRCAQELVARSLGHGAGRAVLASR